MKKMVVAIIVIVLIMLCGCTKDEITFDVVGNNVTIREDTTGDKNIVLVFEVSNPRKGSLYFKESDFDIVDENGKLIDTIQSVKAYPSVISSGETAVYYGGKVSETISDANTKLKAIPHIDVEKVKNKRNEIGINGVTGSGKAFVTGIIENPSSKKEYNNICVAIIRRTQNEEAVSVMTTTINSLKPREQVEFRAEDIIGGRVLEPDVMVTKYQNFAYVLP